MGLWDSTYDVLQDISDQQQEVKATVQTVASTGPITIECKPSVITETKMTKDSPKGKPVFSVLYLLDS